MSEKQITLGFGFRPEESLHHFLVCVPAKAEATVTIYERFSWQSDERVQKINMYDEDKAKAEISKHKWKLLTEALQAEFNARLKKAKKPQSKFIIGQTPVERLLGKELLLLVWAIEDCDPAVILTATRNWLGFAPEERWWLFTMTNAATGGLNDRSGWRKALRYALTENPIEEQRQFSLFDMMIKKGEEE